MLYEMTPKSNLAYDPHTGKFICLVNHGQLGRTSDPANQALVFMTRDLLTDCKQPSGFFFCKNARNSNDLKLLVLDWLETLEDDGLKVKVTVSDQGSCNRAIISELGVTDDKPGFSHKGKEYIVMYDTPTR